MEELAQKFLSANILSLDTETTSTDAMMAELVGLSFSMTPNEAYYIPVPKKERKHLGLSIFSKGV